MAADPILPLVFTRRSALRAGMTRAQCERRVTTGIWRCLRRGAYCRAERWEAADRHTRHRMSTVAALLTMGRGYWASHASAAVVHGLPVPFASTPVWLTTAPGRSTRYLVGLTVMSASLPLAHREVLASLPVTSLARTVADCLRHLDEVDAIAIADAAQRHVPSLAPAVAAVLQECDLWPYAARARQRLTFVDGRRESPAESWSHVAMRRQGLAMPEPQPSIYDERGTFVARVDAWWDDVAVVGEVDGLVKYGVGSDLDPREAAEALVLEKRREDALRRIGAHVVRWGTRDLRDEAGWARMVRGELVRGDRSRFRGTVRLLTEPRVAHQDQRREAPDDGFGEQRGVG